MTLKRLTILSAVSLFFIYFILIFSLFYFVEFNKIWSILTSKRIISAIKLSFFTATVSTLFSMLIAIPSAYALSRYEFPFSKYVDLILELPLVISPVALGASMLIFFNTSFGSFIQNNFISFVFNVKGIILAQFVTTAGLATRVIKSSLDEISIRYENVARCLGATSMKAFKTVTLPMLKGGIISACVIAFAKSLGEFGATVTLAGSMPGKTEVLTTAIFTKLESVNLPETVVLILILVFTGILFIFIARYFTGDRIK